MNAKFRESDLVRSYSKHYCWRCPGCWQALTLQPGDERLGSGRAPVCGKCGSFTAPVNPDIVPELQ